MKWPIVLLIGILFSNCSAKKLTVPTEISLDTPLTIDKTMVLCLSPVNEFRSSFETAMKQKLQFHGIHTETSTQHIPNTLRKNGATENILAELIKSLPKKGFSKLLISAISEVEHTKIDAEGDSGEFELFHFTTHLYTIDEEGSSLTWSVCLCIYDYQVPWFSVEDFAFAIVGKMIKDGVLEVHEVQELKLFAL